MNIPEQSAPANPDAQPQVAGSAPACANHVPELVSAEHATGKVKKEFSIKYSSILNQGIREKSKYQFLQCLG